MAPEDLFNNMSNVPAVVEKVNFEGIKRTKDDVFHSVTKFMMKGKTFDDMMINIGEMQQELIRIGVVRDVSTKLDVGKGDFGYVLTFKIKEPGSVSGGIHTTVGNAEGGVSLKLNFPNTFGRGERFVADIGYGSRSKTDLNMSFYKPYVFKNVLDIGLSAYRRSMMFDASGLKAHDHGIGFNIMRVLGDYTISKTSVEPFIRHVTSCDYKTPFELRNNCGWFFQTSTNMN